MRQLLILAIESVDPIDIDHIALQVPLMIQNARGNGALLAEPFTGKAVAAVAKQCVADLFEKANVPIVPDPSAGDVIRGGLMQMVALLDRHERQFGKQEAFNASVLSTLFGLDAEPDQA